MARPPTDRSKPLPYTPAPPPVAGARPEDVTRAVWDELRKIAEALAQAVP
jgi:hypothetical protein